NGVERCGESRERDAAAGIAMPSGSSSRDLSRQRISAAPLPGPSAELIGRAREVAAVVDRIRREQARLVTLTGPGGIGTPRLAAEIGRELASDFADGVGFVDLSVIPTAEVIAGAIARDLGLNLPGGDEPVAEVMAALRSRALLVILDNFEHVLDAAGT